MGTPKKYNVDRAWFEKKYLVELTPTPIIAREIGCCAGHIGFLARKFGIPVRPRQPKSVRIDRLKIDMVEVARLYLDEMLSCPDIGAIMGCNGTSIHKRLRRYGVKMRHHNDTKRGVPAKNRINIDPSLVAKLYSEKYASTQKVADNFGVSTSVIHRIMRENGIPKKPINEARDYWGPNSPRWRHDLSDEERENRRDDVSQRRWREQIYARDGYTCQKCGDSKGGNLNAHHIIPHCADKTVAWRLDNGITLCAPCHKIFHSTYGLKKCNGDDLSVFLDCEANRAKWPAIVAATVVRIGRE